MIDWNRWREELAHLPALWDERLRLSCVAWTFFVKTTKVSRGRASTHFRVESVVPRKSATSRSRSRCDGGLGYRCR